MVGLEASASGPACCERWDGKGGQRDAAEGLPPRPDGLRCDGRRLFATSC